MVLNFPGVINTLFNESKYFGEGFDPDIQQKTILEQTKYLSIPGNSFLPHNNAVSILRGSSFMYAGAEVVFFAKVNLPHGAVVTGAIVYGSISDETWALKKTSLTDGALVDNMAEANFNTIDTTIASAEIDNILHTYAITTSSLDDTDIIYGAVIRYTI